MARWFGDSSVDIPERVRERMSTLCPRILARFGSGLRKWFLTQAPAILAALHAQAQQYISGGVNSTVRSVEGAPPKLRLSEVLLWALTGLINEKGQRALSAAR